MVQDMGIFQLTHAVLFVSDIDRSVDFSTNDHDHDLALSEVPGAAVSQAGRAASGLYHLAWEVDTLDELERGGVNLATDDDREASKRIGALDINRERARFGGGTRGGIGISHAAPVGSQPRELPRRTGSRGPEREYRLPAARCAGYSGNSLKTQEGLIGFDLGR